MDLFLRACGANGPLLLDVEEQGQRARRSFDQPYVLVGRDPRADLVLDHPEVSRRHAYIQVVEGGVYCVDLESRSGTHWTSSPARSGWLDPHQGIRIGPYTIYAPAMPASLPGQPEPPSPLTVCPASSDEPLDVLLKFQLKMTEPTLWRMRRMLVLVGNSPRCKVRLADPSVSRYHCGLLRTTAGLWVVDLLGRGGVTVNGASIRSARVQNGDELGVGYISIRVRFEKPAPGSRAWTPDPDLASNLAVVSALNRPGAWEPAPASWIEPPSQSAEILTERLTSNGDIPASALVLLMNHFSQMHQQMLEQFQQSTLTMFQMLTNTSGPLAIRDELNRINQVSQELQDLKAELAAKQPGLSSTAPLSALPAPGPDVAPPASSPPPEPAALESRGGSAAPPVDVSSSNGMHAPEVNGAPQPSTASADPSLRREDQEAHDWLFRQIVEFQCEQQSRWQKIRELVLGK